MLKVTRPRISLAVKAVSNLGVVAGHVVGIAREWTAFFRGAAKRAPDVSLSANLHPTESKLFGMLRDNMCDIAEHQSDEGMREALDSLLAAHKNLISAVLEVTSCNPAEDDELDEMAKLRSGLRTAFAGLKKAMRGAYLKQERIGVAVSAYIDACRPFCALAKEMESEATRSPDAPMDAEQLVREIHKIVSDIATGGTDWQEIVIARINRIHERMDAHKSNGKYAKNLGDGERAVAKRLWERGRRQVEFTNTRVSFEDVYNAPLFKKHLNALGINSADEFQNAVQTHDKNTKNRRKASGESE